MADNFNFTEGSGAVGAADDVSSVYYPFVKLTDATLNSTTGIYVDIGAKANALRVVPANDITDGTYIGDIKFGEALPANTNTQEVVGDAAENANAAGNPLLCGGRYDSSPRTLGDTDVGAIALAVDGAVHIDDGGNTITVDGSLTTVSTVTNLSQLGGTAITMDEGVHDAGCQRVTIATDDDGVLSLGIIDDWDATHASTAPADGVCIMGAGYSAALPTDVGADADAARLVTDRYGRLCTGLQPQAAKAIVDNADTTTAREIVAAVATRRIFVTSLIISVDTAGNYWLEDGDATAVTSKMYFAANGGCAITFPEGTPLNTVTQNKALNVKGSTAGNVGVTITYYLAV